MCNWNQPNFSPVTVAVESAAGKVAFTETFTPTANVGNDATKSFSGTTLLSSNFEVTEKDRYTVTFYTADAQWADLVIGQAALGYKGALTAVDAPQPEAVTTTYYTLAGVPVTTPARGIYIERQVAPDGRCVSRKVAF
jgi:hypothetical protein